MLHEIRHRGPDGQGVWTDDDDPAIALGNCRLAIVDRSVHGSQPMTAASGNLIVTFNGEIYNHELLRGDLEAKGAVFRGHSDTEVLAHALDVWGVDRTVDRLNGMFAFAAWDRSQRRLFLARDRLGEKPLYFGCFGQRFAFASELDALIAAARVRPELDRDAVTLYVRHSYIPAPHTIYRGVRKLEPGCVASINAQTPAPEVETRRYWSAWSAPSPGSDRADLECLLTDAVAIRSRADVPVGVFLSGGIDSSTVTALLARDGGTRPKTFTLGFDDGVDERQWARRVARHLGTDHTELDARSADALALIPRLPAVYDEPFGDPSQIPTLLLAGLARESITVAITGDGGDEVFAGYDRYRSAPRRKWGRARRPPAVSYHRRVSRNTRPESIVLGGREPATAFTDTHEDESRHDVDWMQRMDLTTFLPDYILTKVDRATMAVGLEARAPFLDHRVVEAALALPARRRIHRGETKLVLRDVLRRHLPDELIDRPKVGFDPPLDAWLRGPLREWGEASFSRDRLQRDGLLDVDGVRSEWHNWLDGRGGDVYGLWALLMLQTWLDAHQ